MRWARLFAFTLCALAGCGAGPVASGRGADRPPPHGAAAAPPDRALTLAAELPAGADRCVVARPSRVPAARRPLLARLSHAEPFAWLAELEITAYAAVQRENRDGPSSSLTLLWIDAPPERARALLDEHAGLALRWNAAGASCSRAECPLRARFVRDHVLSIERGPFVPGSRGGAEVHCRQLAERSPLSVEVSVTRMRTLGAFQLRGLPARSSSLLAVSPAGVRVVRTNRMRTPEEAERALLDGLLPDAILARGTPFGSRVRRERTGPELHTRFELTWHDLELARADEARLEAAARALDALVAVAPEPGEPAASREDVLAELGFRLERMTRTTGEARRAELQAVRALLEQACERNPEDEGLALLLVELLLSETGDVAQARALVARFAGRPGAHRSWAVLERHAAALSGPDALAAALVKHRVVERRRARALAHEIIARMREGMAYERAERAAGASGL